MTIMLKKIFSIIGLIIAVLVGLIGLLLLIMGIVETIPSMWICGMVFTALSVLGGVYCGKRVPKVKHNFSEKDNSNEKHHSKLKKPEFHCIICGNYFSDILQPKYFGCRVCPKCVRTLSKNGVSFWQMKNYTLNQLKRFCGITNPISQFLVDENITPSEKLQYLTIEHPTIVLKKGEVCYYEYGATAYHEKNIVTGHSNSGAGMSFRVADGVYLRTGGGDSQVIRENVGEYFEGTLYITNFRIVLLTPKYGFDIPFSKINQIIEHSDGFQIYSGAKCYSVLTIDIHTFIAIVKLLESINQDTALSNPKAYKTNNKANSTEPNMDDLRELRKLFDEGIITEEEFNAKKKQILGL